MLAASLEWPFALRMALRVSTCEDLTARSDESRSRPLPCTRLVSAGLDLLRTADSGLLRDRSISSGNHDAIGCSWAISITCTPGDWAIFCRTWGTILNGGKAYRRPLSLSQGMDMASVHSALGSGYGDTNLTSRLLANVANISICGSPHLANTGRRLSMAIVHSLVSVWPTLDRESAWMLRTPGRWTGTNVIALLSHHLSSRMVICIKVCDLVPPSFLMYVTVTALSHISRTTRYLRWGRKSLTA